MRIAYDNLLIAKPPERDGRWRYDPVGRCIYCKSTVYSPEQPDRGLGLEHIIPQSLDGRFLLPEAACGKCEGITSSFEGKAARAVFGPLRIHLGLPTKRPGDRPRTLPVSAYFAGSDAPVSVDVPIEQHPLSFALTKMAEPFFFRRRSDDEAERRLVVIFPGGKELADRRMARIAQNIGARRVEIEAVVASSEFVLLLAKIGHALACAMIGMDNFDPFLPDLIRRKDAAALRMFVGGCRTRTKPENDPMHDVTLYRLQRGKNLYLALDVSLFSPLGLPYYSVVIGRLYERAPQATVAR